MTVVAATGSSGSSADVQRQLARLRRTMGDDVSIDAVVKVLSRVQLIESVVDEVISGIKSWPDTTPGADPSRLLVPETLHKDALSFLATLDV
jgi:hypothetical protein